MCLYAFPTLFVSIYASRKEGSVLRWSPHTIPTRVSGDYSAWMLKYQIPEGADSFTMNKGYIFSAVPSGYSSKGDFS